MKHILKNLFDIIVIPVVALVLFASGFGVGENVARDLFEQQAVRAGVAHYVFDDAGDPHFEWRKP